MRRGSKPRSFSATKRAIDGGVNTMINGENNLIKDQEGRKNKQRDKKLTW
jgi:hypothetical protein